ncbi:FliC/FljB family flagellin [Alcaligenes nematophilus]|uniref:Flagellin n=1 Tax=Alcaligenes nematophilus TaxID=2994643 RepID=A0ABU3MVA5_9BURK|nr:MULTISPECIES: FliC/FljB family flagellin [Alcaligenes]MDT8463802.1 FliC/FljB family flagellin [Alcaligenes nematophilus]MDT8468344.1 FliC/FljB family flagellin [Alcaligenes nematophilus]MDT8505684.1 FliC/FljB family flagellin [Alcaligenes nematophilus]MDT8524573.1 FliC/FljB family flagellin [Alcaligenes nematophilus]QCP83440.1 FliC/FljB family flagellin [Alcaligenes faecalis]
MSVINTNSLSLVAQGNLSKSQGALGQAIERLSSGLRINSAKDDAAGQAIANRFTANVNGLTQAARNANDGISIAQTTEGSLNEINNNLQRIRTLSVQATTGTNSETDLDSIQAEINQRLAEINRVSEQTQFNGVKVLAKDQSLAIQVGANDGETISVNLKQIDSGTLDLDGLDVASLAKKFDASSFELAAATGTGTAATPAQMGDSKTAVTVTGGGSLMTIKGQPTAGGTAGADTHYIVKDGKAYAATVTGDAATNTVTAAVNGDAITDEAVLAKVTPLAAIDKAIQDVDNLRSDLGAVQNRFESTIANLNNTVTNLSASRSRIEDADYAVEVSNMTRAQILQQAGTSVLAQANQVPQTVLSLLR